MGLAAVPENLRDARSGSALDLAVEVDERTSQQSGSAPAGRGLPGARQADEDDVWLPIGSVGWRGGQRAGCRSEGEGSDGAGIRVATVAT